MSWETMHDLLFSARYFIIKHEKAHRFFFLLNDGTFAFTSIFLTLYSSALLVFHVPHQSPINSPYPFFKPLNPYRVLVLNISIDFPSTHNPSSPGLPGLSLAPSLIYYVFLPSWFLQAKNKIHLFTLESNMASQYDHVFKII